jgi:hypothetical protein
MLGGGLTFWFHIWEEQLHKQQQFKLACILYVYETKSFYGKEGQYNW